MLPQLHLFLQSTAAGISPTSSTAGLLFPSSHNFTHQSSNHLLNYPAQNPLLRKVLQHSLSVPSSPHLILSPLGLHNQTNNNNNVTKGTGHHPILKKSSNHNGSHNPLGRGFSHVITPVGKSPLIQGLPPTPVSMSDVVSHKKLDRSVSEPVDKSMSCASSSNSSSSPCHGRGSSTSVSSNSSPTCSGQAQQQQQQQQQNSSRYKTELCRPFEENGTCKYGDKCQFAHGYHELRNLQRHPKYKTELCRTFHTTGFCPYGPRCHFVHNSEETKKTVMIALGQTNGPETIVGARPLLSARRSAPSDSMFSPFSGVQSLSMVSAQSMDEMTLKTNDLLSGSNKNGDSARSSESGRFSLPSSRDMTPPSSPSNSPTSVGMFFGNENDTLKGVLSNLKATSSIPVSSTAPASSIAAISTVAPSVSTSTMTSSFNGESMFSFNLLIPEPPSPFVKNPFSDYPGAPSSPVDSLESDLDLLSLGSSSDLQCGSPLETASAAAAAVAASIPRLPTFARFSNSSSFEVDS